MIPKSLVFRRKMCTEFACSCGRIAHARLVCANSLGGALNGRAQLKLKENVFTYYKSSVAAPRRIDTDPNTNFLFHTEPDSALDPKPNFTLLRAGNPLI